MSESYNELNNLLPTDGQLYYKSNLLSKNEIEICLKNIEQEIHFNADVIKLFGKTIETKRLVAWHGDEGISYKYSGVTKQAKAWTKTLNSLKKIVEEFSGQEFNSVLLNYYEDGNIGMAYHSDDEPELRENGCIASLSLGARRKMLFRHKFKDEKVDLWLDSGSLLLMEGEIQDHWKHAIPKTKCSDQVRINLTFRQIEQNS